jgi:hypothetical protein
MTTRCVTGMLLPLLLLSMANGQAQSDPGAPSAEPVPGFASVDIGGRSLRYKCVGSRTPTVIIEAGGGVSVETVISWNLSRGWPVIIPAVAKKTRVCAYDRAGLGRSDKAPLPRTSLEVAKDLRALLEKADISPPYVLAGQSLGGMNARMFTHLYPETVAGVVLVDSSHPDEYSELAKVLPLPLPLPGDKKGLADLSTRSKFIIATTAGHNIQADEPQLVIDAILDVVEQVRSLAKSH